jgi:hypothetical protein
MEEDERCAFCPVLFVQGFSIFKGAFKENSFENTKRRKMPGPKAFRKESPEECSLQKMQRKRGQQ